MIESMCKSNKLAVSMNKKRRPRARNSRNPKTKRPKFLSLRHQFPPPNETTGDIKRFTAMGPNTTAAVTDSPQLHLIPLHPENERESLQDQAEDVALFFSSADGGATTLTGLLDNSSTVDSNSSNTNNNTSRLGYLSPSSASLTYAYEEDRAALVRNALRSRDRDSSDEKWVCYSEVVERKMKEEEVTSSAVDRRPAAVQRVALKLDYEEIMNAWSNKGPLYIDTDSCPQIVPDINHDFIPHEGSNNGVSCGCNVGLWTVPEMVRDAKNGEMRKKNEEEMKHIGQREASVLRYKEKRQNRLFSKKIRYQVRKVNAEKRPRLKGRFVKRS